VGVVEGNMTTAGHRDRGGQGGGELSGGVLPRSRATGGVRGGSLPGEGGRRGRRWSHC
jgi:hypothetical protein